MPTITDDVIVSVNILSNSGPAASISTLTMQSGVLGINLTASSGVTFNGTSSLNTGRTITGNAIFNNSSIHRGIVTGDATFNQNSAINFGTVNGSATFNNSSSISGFG